MGLVKEPQARYKIFLVMSKENASGAVERDVDSRCLVAYATKDNATKLFDKIIAAGEFVIALFG